MRLVVLFAVSTLLSVGNAYAINKCMGPAGQVVYQDAPCDGAKSVDTSGAGKGDPNSPGSAYWKREAAKNARGVKVQNAVASREIFIGMTADEVVQSWGKPTRINSTVGSYGKHEQWIFDRGAIGRAQYVYFENGVVRSMQSPE